MSTQNIEETFTTLIMDDDACNRKLFRIMLESAGYESREAEDGLYGLHILMHRTFNLLILDLAMPYIDGETILQTLKRRPMHDKMRIVVVTANASSLVGETRQLADHILHKPIDVLAFRDFVTSLKNDPNATYCPAY